MAAPEANAEQTRYWNEAAGPKWVSFQKIIDAQIGPLGHRAMDRAGIAPGERVVDVGCGCGDTTITLGGRVGPQGLVVGIDISAPMLARAVEAARGTVRRSKPPRKRSAELAAVEATLQRALMTRVRIRGSERTGTIEIGYANAEELERLAELLGGRA